MEQLDATYPPELKKVLFQSPKYIMGRSGTQVGKYPPIIFKEGASKWRINGYYLPFIDEILKNEPVFKEHLTENSWMAEHGKCIKFWEEIIAPPGLEEAQEEEDEDLPDALPDDDSVWQQTKDLLDHGAAGIIYSGPPGTGKTWYADKIAIKLTGGKSKRIKHIQFHPSYNYDDFIEGYVPAGKEGSEPLFKTVDKIFLQLCEAARRDPDNIYVIVIDEFSRGDPSRVFGELLTYIERKITGKRSLLFPY